MVVPWRAQDFVHCQLRRRARRPQLKRDPLDSTRQNGHQRSRNRSIPVFRGTRSTGGGARRVRNPRLPTALGQHAFTDNEPSPSDMSPTAVFGALILLVFVIVSVARWRRYRR